MADFIKLAEINVNEHVEKKEGLSYLSWAWAWDYIKRLYPDAQYEIKRFANDLPYVYDPNTGYMVFTSVTIDGLTHEMWLPVMDGKNKAMKDKEYTYITKSYGKEVEKTVQPATMFDINKTIMRCLVKNLAMFGLGLYIYNGEDLPVSDNTEQTAETQTVADPVEDATLRAKVLAYVTRNNFSEGDVAKICKHYKVNKIIELSGDMCKDYISKIEAKGGSIDG